MNDTPDILRRILARKRAEIAERQTRVSVSDRRARGDNLPPARGFAAQMETAVATGHAAVIAEIKRASPSKGLLREPFKPAGIARSYAAHGATCLSVLTDRDFFQGADEHVAEARSACPLPVLRKDFTIDHYQVLEARAIGADCILLIAAALEDSRLAELQGLAAELGLDVLMEIHDGAELERIHALRPRLLGINNRDLRSFETRLETTLELLPMVPTGCTVITESGIHTPADVAVMRNHDVNGFLVGETFMRAPDPGAKLAELFSE